MQLLKHGMPHTLLFTGPSGCGKTTFARILQKKLNCSDQDFSEINCADMRGIDTIRSIRQRIGLAPIAGTSRIWLIDEAHRLTGEAQDAALKLLEDTPNHVYFILCTTNPNKLAKTIITRCTEIRVQQLGTAALKTLLNSVLAAEKKTLDEDVADHITEAADGCARKALVLLEQVVDLPTAEQQVDAILKADSKRQSIEIARALIDKNTNWAKMAKILKGCDELDNDAEGLRWMVMAYANTILLSGGQSAGRAYLIIQTFRDHLFDSKKYGFISNCFDVIVGNK
jgi:DNA polymerase-3 subunit gamma/tau